MPTTSMNASVGYSSLNRGLEILGLVQTCGRMRAHDISRRLDLPLSTVYRYLSTLRKAGFLVDVDGHVMPSARLSETGEETEHLVRYAAPALRRMRDASSMTSVLAVRIHTAAVSLDVAFAHSKHRISFSRGQVRALYAGGSALPLLAWGPPAVVREVLDGEFRRYTAATPTRETIESEIEEARLQGYCVSGGHLTPGMIAIGIPVVVDGRCLCSLSLVGEKQAAPASTETAVEILRRGRRELLARLPSDSVKEAWLSPDE